MRPAMRHSAAILVVPGLLLAAACGQDVAGTAENSSLDSSAPAISEPVNPVRESVAAAEIVSQQRVSPTPTDPAPEDEETLPDVAEILPERFAALWAPWEGDLEGMVERRAIRVLVPFGGYQFYFVRGRPRGAIVELLQRFEEFINDELDRDHVRVYVVPIPVSRDRLLPDLIAGHADLVAADLTITAARTEDVVFSRPLLRDINEVIVAGPAARPLKSLEDLSEQEVVVRESSSYYEHLQSLAETFTDYEREPPVIVKADELLEAEDLMEMVNAGMIQMTVLDDYKARFWSSVFPDLDGSG